MIQPDIDLEYGDRAQLAALSTMEGYKILHRIMRTEADKFIVALINADASDEREVIAKHRLAKAAAQFYQAVANRLNEEIMLYTQAPKPSDKPRDVTEGVIDIGVSAEWPHVGNPYDYSGEERF